MTIDYDDLAVWVTPGAIGAGGLRDPLAECLLEHRDRDRGVRRLKIRARWPGNPVHLFQPHDVSRCGRICRALPRVVESKPVADRAVERNQPARNR
ncbi:hypothetical protein [Micromonospora deserti]|uniref:Uncharacterized protein n=1 Tax=Micromonospora deserti TaxID=2070366 RepID=A0A2W2CYF8_9ACTN|nr:hypothetical protein [Micromonospora deserti]PZG02941.1 hypothetical protein C1I99_00305 [Micromonospora deserti]